MYANQTNSPNSNMCSFSISIENCDVNTARLFTSSDHKQQSHTFGHVMSTYLRAVYGFHKPQCNYPQALWIV